MRSQAQKTKGDKGAKVDVHTGKASQHDATAPQFTDSRPETMAQMKLQEAIGNSPRVQQLSSFQEMANNSPRAQQAARLQAMSDQHTTQTRQFMGADEEEEEEETVRGKFDGV